MRSQSCTTCLAALMALAGALNADAGNDDLTLDVLVIHGGGAANDMPGDLRLDLTIGEPLVGVVASSSLSLSFGFFNVIAEEPVRPPLSPADLDGDGDVDGLDLATLLGQWTGPGTYAPCPPHQQADLNQDCKINGLDLAILLGAWNP